MTRERVASRLVDVARLPPAARHEALAAAHERLAAAQVAAVRALTAVDAARVLCDGTTVAQVVGHVAAWERFVCLAFDELRCGVQWPGIMRTAGWREPGGGVIDFANPDQFTAYVAQRDARRPWEDIRGDAVASAERLREAVAAPSSILECGAPHVWRRPGIALPPLPVGWTLWFSALWHAGVTHALYLGVPMLEL